VNSLNNNYTVARGFNCVPGALLFFFMGFNCVRGVLGFNALRGLNADTYRRSPADFAAVLVLLPKRAFLKK
jgi:hypothetical protein